MCFRAPGLQFVSSCDAIEGLEDELCEDAPVMVDALPAIPEDALQRTECDEMEVQLFDESIVFRAFPKHGDEVITPAAVPRKLLEGLLVDAAIAHP